MTKVTVEFKSKHVNVPVEIKQGQYVEIDGDVYICAYVRIGSAGVGYLQLTNIIEGSRWDDPQKGETYTYKDEYPIRS